jgi:hypothetical protein
MTKLINFNKNNNNNENINIFKAINNVKPQLFETTIINNNYRLNYHKNLITKRGSTGSSVNFTHKYNNNNSYFNKIKYLCRELDLENRINKQNS